MTFFTQQCSKSFFPLDTVTSTPYTIYHSITAEHTLQIHQKSLSLSNTHECLHSKGGELRHHLPLQTACYWGVNTFHFQMCPWFCRYLSHLFFSSSTSFCGKWKYLRRNRIFWASCSCSCTFWCFFCPYSF